MQKAPIGIIFNDLFCLCVYCFELLAMMLLHKPELEVDSTLTNGELFLRLLMAIVLGGLVGLERERHNRPAGLRTHILVCLGSTLVMIVSVGGFGSSSPMGGDPSRIASQVVSGIGFLGAGTILRQGGSVRGLTTAASIWVVAAIGLSVGIGLFVPATLTTIFVLFCLWVLNKVESHTGKDHSVRKQLFLRMKKQAGLIEMITGLLQDLHIDILSMHMLDSGYNEATAEDEVELTFILQIPPAADWALVFRQLLQIPGVIESSVENVKRRFT